MQLPFHPFEVMAKPIGARCNIACSYCYYLEKQKLYPTTKKFAMSTEVLETYIRDYIAVQVAINRPEIDFNWQGGEPTLLGIDFFQRVVGLQKRYAPTNVRIVNAIQTNGTLLDERWAAFLKEHGFLVGLSLDGPPLLHDAYRRDRTGGATHARVMAGMELLQRHDVEFNTLTVVHRYNAESPRAVYQFLKKVGVRYMQFVPVVERLAGNGCLAAAPQIDSDAAEYKVAPWSVLPTMYGDFLCGLFDEWIKEDVGHVFVQLFDVQLGLWMNRPASLCWFAETCGGGLALEHNGDLFACDYYVYPEYLRGNILEKPIGFLASQLVQVDFGREKSRSLPRQCVECAFLFACNGGCPKHRFLATAEGGAPLNYFCQSLLHFFKHAGPRLQMMAKLVGAGRPAADIMPRRFGRVSASAYADKPGRNDKCPCGSGKKFKACHGSMGATK